MDSLIPRLRVPISVIDTVADLDVGYSCLKSYDGNLKPPAPAPAPLPFQICAKKKGEKFLLYPTGTCTTCKTNLSIIYLSNDYMVPSTP